VDIKDKYGILSSRRKFKNPFMIINMEGIFMASFDV
jgi:hypothetical protein